MSDAQLILASASPRRRELLADMGLRFDVETADVEELGAESCPPFSPAELAMENARRKAVAVALKTKSPACPVLGADTVVVLENRLFGKPASLEQAREFLQALSGRTHEVITGCALLALDRKPEIFHEISRITFRAFNDDTIARYLAEVSVLDKAGAYALQERGEWIVERVEGSRTNVIGLPTERLKTVLEKRGFLS